MIIKWVERRKEYLYLVPRVATLIASSPLKPSYIKERDLELIPQIVSLPAPVLEKLMYDTSDIFNSILSALKGDNVSRAIELVEEEIRKRYEDSDIHLSPPVCRLIASECIKLVYVAEKLGLDLSSPNDMRELMNLYSMFVYIINRVNFTIAVAEVPQMIIDMISFFAKLTPSQGEGSQQSIDVESLKRKLREYLNASLSTAPSRILDLAREYENLLPRMVEFVNEYISVHDVIAPIFTEATGIYPYISSLLHGTK